MIVLEIDWLNITPSGSFFVKSFCRHYQKNDSKIEAVIDNLTFWSNLILKQIIRYSEEANEELCFQLEFTISQMLQTTKYLDLFDEAGRRRLKSLLEAILAETTLNSEILEYSIILLEKISDDTGGFLDSITTVIQKNQLAVENHINDGAEELLNSYKCLEIILYTLRCSNQVLFTYHAY